VRRHTSLLHFPPNQQACTNRSFVCQTLAWLREPACSGVGLTIDITVLPELSVCFLHGSLSLSPSILELSVCFLHGSSLILCAACSASGQRSKREHSKAPASLIDNWLRLRTKKASKVEKPSSRGVSSLHRWSLMLLPVLWLMPLRALCTHVCVSTTLSLLSLAWLPHYCSFFGAGTHDSDGPLGLNVVTY